MTHYLRVAALVALCLSLLFTLPVLYGSPPPDNNSHRLDIAGRAVVASHVSLAVAASALDWKSFSEVRIPRTVIAELYPHHLRADANIEVDCDVIHNWRAAPLYPLRR